MNPNFIPLNAVSTRRFDLDAIQIAAPCRADWDAMSGDDQVRHCQSCAKNVYNLSALTRAEAVRLIEETEGHLCVQLHRRADGTLLTSDCNVGISSLKKSSGAVRHLFAAAMAAILGAFGVATVSADTKPVRTMGAPRMGDVSVGRGEMAPAATKPVPEMGTPKVPIRTVTMGRMRMPVTKVKSAKNHAKSASKPANKPRSR